jgi:7-cyano-7-deazaguanine reductase
MDTLDRRKLLVTEANPDANLDYLAALDGDIAPLKGCAGGTASLRLVYVPDKAVLPPAGFSRYLEALGKETWVSLEGVAVTVLGDINNELVPRWVRVRVAAESVLLPGVSAHTVTAEDHQPGWDNPALLSRLKRI